jgi:hypothetical protein
VPDPGRDGDPAGVTAGRPADALVEPAAGGLAKPGQGISVSHDSIMVLWRGFCLQPHHAEGFKFSTDPRLDAKVRDVVGLYLEPPQNAIVVRVDEKPQVQVQALDRTRPSMRPGIPGRHTHGYIRHGTTARSPSRIRGTFAVSVIACPSASRNSCGPSSGHVTYIAGKTRPPTFPSVSGTRSFDVTYMCSCYRTCAQYVRGDVW